MAVIYPGGTFSGLQQQMIDTEAYDARYAKAVLLGQVLNKSTLSKPSNYKVTIEYESKTSTSAVTSTTGAFTPAAQTYSSVDVTLDQWANYSREVVGNTKPLATIDAWKSFARNAGLAFGETYDNALWALHTSLSSYDVGQSAAVYFDAKAMSQALLSLVNNNVPQDELVFVVPPEATIRDLANLPQMLDANKSGLPKSVMLAGFQGMLKGMGLPLYVSNLSPSTTNTAGQPVRVGLCMHQTALACAFNRDQEMEEASRVGALYKSRVRVADSIYGVNYFRTDHAARIMVAA